MIHHQLRQAFIYNVGVNLGCGDVSVAQHGLDRAQIGTTCQEVRCKSVAQGMGRHLGRGDIAKGREGLDPCVKPMPRQVAQHPT